MIGDTPMVRCTNTECTEHNVAKDTEQLTEFYGYDGYPVTCGTCGDPCAWDIDEKPDPE